jgi:hypothetical protein
MIITPEEFLEWVDNPVTKGLKKALHKDREYLKEMLVRGNVDNVEEVKGRCNAVLNIINLTYEDLVEGIKDE